MVPLLLLKLMGQSKRGVTQIMEAQAHPLVITISRLSLDSKLVKSVSDLKKIGEYSGFQRYVCKNDNGGWVQSSGLNF
jgi:hypothetical protein